jgi:hypothetical protein
VDIQDRAMIGQRFGKLVVLKRSSQHNTPHRYYECQCDCGRKHTARGATLRDGKTWQCKLCAAQDTVQNRARKPARRARKPVSKAEEFAYAVYTMAALHKLEGTDATADIMELAHARLRG